MITIIRGLAVGVVVAGAAVGLASPASADLHSGSYTATVTNGGGRVRPGVTHLWTLTSCGSGCLHIHGDDPVWDKDIHLQGNTWTPADNGFTIDNDSLVESETFNGANIQWQWAQNG